MTLFVRPQIILYRTGHLNAASDRNEINIFRGAMKHQIAHISPHDIAFATDGISRIPYEMEHRAVNLANQFRIKNKRNFFVCQHSNLIRLATAGGRPP